MTFCKKKCDKCQKMSCFLGINSKTLDMGGVEVVSLQTF